MFERTTNSAKGQARKVVHTAGLAILLLFVLFAVEPAHAQLNSTVGSVNLNASLIDSLTVTASPGLVNFTLVPNGTATGSAVINVTTRWTLDPSVVAVTTYAYFSAAAAALSDGSGDNIPSSSVNGSVNGGAFGPFTGASPFAANSSVTLSSTQILGNNRSSSHSDTLNLNINTTGLALPAGTYTGTLHLQAQAL